MRYALAAAGTGGHVYPALAVARALTECGVEADDIVFFGGNRLEATVVPQAGYTFVEVEVRGLERSLTPRNVTLPIVVTRAARAIADRVRRTGIGVMAAFGGYVSVPAAWGAKRAGARLVVHEQNAVPGLANRLIAARADTTLVAFEAATERLQGARVVGNPLRADVERFDRERLRPEALRHYGLDGRRPVLGVLGGSLGARILNETAELLTQGEARAVDLVHLTGTIHVEAITPRAASDPRWTVLPFEERMDLFYAASDLVLSRAGALTISELAATGTPAVVVPYAAGTAGHQAANAAGLSAAGGCLIVPEAEVAVLPDLLLVLLDDPARLESMGAGARAVGRPDAAIRVARAILGVNDDGSS
jgi:UDP-N-acetylglucosamine--N-acetylmuramyl-(pentapeptide) pyrophosphoryl-undecaprenol N-acetylglucosamine transferase